MRSNPTNVLKFSFQNAGYNAADIFIDGAIVDASTQEFYKNYWGDDTTVSFKSFRQQVEESGAQTFNVYINSPGGQVTDAMAIHDLLVDLQAKGKTVNTIGRGIIASSATYILMAGNNPEMSENSWFMIHNVGGGVYGDVNDVENYAVTLRKFNDSARDFYATRTGIRKEEITKMMNSETWLTASEAMDKGFVKQISNAVEFTNAIAKENWDFKNLAVLNSYNSAVKNDADTNFDQMKKLFENFSTNLMNTIKGIKPVENKDGGAFDQTALTNSIAEAISNSFGTIGEEMETTVNDLVNNAVDAAVETAVAEAVKNAVAEAVAPLNNKIEELEAANKELVDDVANAVGAPTNTKADKNAPKTVGKFSN